MTYTWSLGHSGGGRDGGSVLLGSNEAVSHFSLVVHPLIALQNI